MLASMLRLQRVGPDDWRVWRELRLAALADAPYAFGSRLADWESATEGQWRDRLSQQGSVNVVAWLDEQPVGMASGVPADTAAMVELISMWVAPIARGRGVGDALIVEVERWACSVGAATLCLQVAKGNLAAAALYGRHGFRDTGEPPHPMPDGTRCEFAMSKQLTPT